MIKLSCANMVSKFCNSNISFIIMQSNLIYFFTARKVCIINYNLSIDWLGFSSHDLLLIPLLSAQKLILINYSSLISSQTSLFSSQTLFSFLALI